MRRANAPATRTTTGAFTGAAIYSLKNRFWLARTRRESALRRTACEVAVRALDDAADAVGVTRRGGEERRRRNQRRRRWGRGRALEVLAELTIDVVLPALRMNVACVSEIAEQERRARQQ